MKKKDLNSNFFEENKFRYNLVSTLTVLYFKKDWR